MIISKSISTPLKKLLEISDDYLFENFVPTESYPTKTSLHN